MKSILLSTILVVPLLLTACAGPGVDVGVGVGYPYYYYDDGTYVGDVYYGPHYYGHYGHYHHYDRGYSHVASNAAVRRGTHFTGTRTASVSSSGYRSGGSHASSAHVSASGRHD
jgi:hypothetical protein